MESYSPSEHDHNRSHFPASSTPNGAPFRLDEGFSEDASNQDEHGRNTFAATAAKFQEWVMAQNEDARAEIAYEVLRTLRTSNIAAVVEKLTPLLHMDPIEKLPPEVTSEIFSYLDAQTLLTASLSSQSWRARIFDARLWQTLFHKQGWGANAREVAAFEESRSNLWRNDFKKARSQFRSSDGGDGPQHKRRATAERLEARNKGKMSDVSSWREQHSVIEADSDAVLDQGDHEMQDVIHTSAGSPPRAQKRHSHDSGDEMDFRLHDLTTRQPMAENKETSSSVFIPRLVTVDGSGAQHIDWSYLYKQRQRLEENWTKGAYTSFELPHPSHAYEAHTECVYTIQFYGKWLVSGSRDKTLRIWDLETRRLRGKPLTGHLQSVLCLQFDPTEEEDVIVSGSSDSSIIVWRFSTGQKLLEIPHAHEESVLNLRFDHRYLVTCSKDKKIKVWNRRQLAPGDADYPKVSRTNSAKTPSYIVDVSGMEPSLLEARIANGLAKSLKPYTHLVTLEGHGAAVNAIQIYDDMIVSASGDRLIKVWNVKDGKLLRTLPGHQKGIACVQFDGRRIVSGSSDNTVRIYDPYTGAEVAELKGHTNLVRTVQAGFGDLPTGEEDDANLARAAERKYLADVANGVIVEDRRQSRRHRSGEEGSSRLAFGSRLPPGGGGSKWGKIVSGSYDESIIIWRKNANGDWVVGLTLRQDATSRVNAEQFQQQQRVAVVTPAPQALPAATALPTPMAPAQPSPASSSMNGAAKSSVMSASQVVQSAIGTSFASMGTGLSNVVGLARNLNTQVPPWNSSTTGGPSSGPSAQQPFQQLSANVSAAMIQALHQQHALQQQNLGPPALPGSQSYHQQSTSSSLQGQPSQSTAGASTVAGPSQNHASHQDQTNVSQTHPPPPPPQNQHQNQPQHPNQSQQSSVSRVFKLQFDARRIVCCSQDSRIIGWDFANGDAEIMEACPFFIGP